MAEVTTSTATAAGLTVLGVATGLEPGLILAGFVGALWAQTYIQTAPYLQRLLFTVLGSIVAALLAPAGAALVTAIPGISAAVPLKTLEVPAAVVIGLLCHRYLGPLLMRLAERKTEDTPK